MRGRGLLAVGALMLAAACGADSGSGPFESEPPVDSLATAPAAPPTVDSEVPVPNPEDPVDELILRSGGVGATHFGTPADDSIQALSALLGPPDVETAIPADAECVEGAGWLDCVGDFRVIDEGTLITWDDHGLAVALVDSDGVPPLQHAVPLQFGDWQATPASGDIELRTPEGVFPGMTVAALRRTAPEVAFGYNEGLLDSFSFESTEGGGFWGQLDWSPSVEGSEFSDLIRAVQRALNSDGADLVVDGEWGPATQAAWTHFHATHGLPLTTLQPWLTPAVGEALGLPPDVFVVGTLEPRPAT